MLDLERLFAGPMPVPHVVNFLPILGPFNHWCGVASDGAHDLYSLSDSPDLFHFLLVGLGRS